ncbi:MAG: RidA family protein [Phycisphaeraceae bacterium]|nr:MAG: RidA family protein [Phycisphaeraceae bacterium]
MTPDFQRFSTGNQWERAYAFSRGVRAGDLIFIGGTAPVAADGSTFAPGDARAQTLRCFEIVEKTLAEMGAGRQHIVRSRMYVTDISRSDEFGRAHAEFFGDHRPGLTMVEVSGLIDPAMLVEVECDAVGP